MTAVFINGRFMTQPVTGVQRFSMEMTAAIDRLIETGSWAETALLMPGRAGGRGGSSFRHLVAREVGRTNGHMWEQTELARAACGGVLVSLGNTAPLLAGRRQVVVIHDAGVFDTPESYSRRFRGWYKALQHALVRRGARIATVSRFSRDRIASKLGLDRDRIAVLSEGADHILRAAPDPDTLARHGLQAGRFALVVGNRVPHKNLHALGRTASMLARRGLVVASAGAFYPGVFRDEAQGGELERKLGFVSDAELHALYRSAALLLFPSRYEGFGLPPLEAMACGCPVVASESGAVEEICGSAALYFETGDPDASCAAAERLLDEPGLANRMRTDGLVRAAGFSWAASARVLGDVVRDILPAPWRDYAPATDRHETVRRSVAVLGRDDFRR